MGHRKESVATLLHASGLTKDYGTFRALSALTLQIQPGEIVGLLGPNGSGKTTALRLFLGFTRPSSGSARIADFDCWHQSVEVRRRVAYLPGELRLYEGMTGRRLIGFLASLRGQSDFTAADSLARQLDINLDQPLTQMSSGMKRKVALIAVLTPNVPLIILDEPTNTLDPTMRDELLVQLLAAKAAGKAVLFSSHVLHEVEAICDRVVILKKGKLVHEQPLADLRRGRHITARWIGPPAATGPDGRPLVNHQQDNGRLNLTYTGDMPALMQWLARQPIDDVRIEPQGLAPIYQRLFNA